MILPQHLWVRVYVPEPWLGHIKLNEPVKVRVDSFPNRDFEGTVEQINRAAEFTPRNVQTQKDRQNLVFGVTVRVPNPKAPVKGRLKTPPHKVHKSAKQYRRREKHPGRPADDE